MKGKTGFRAAGGAWREAAGRIPAAFAVAALHALAIWWVDGQGRLAGAEYMPIALEAAVAVAVSALAGLAAEWRGWGCRTRGWLQAAVFGVFAVRVAWGWGEAADAYGMVSRLALAVSALALAAWVLGACRGRAEEAGPRLAVGAAVGGAATLGLWLGCVGIMAVLDTLFKVKSVRVAGWFFSFAAGPAVSLGALTALAWATAQKPFSMPAAWRALLKWVALPVHAAFTAVLLAYFAWCTARWDLPSGKIAPFATVAGLGWVALRLLAAGEPGVTGKYARWGGLAVLPLTALQFAALGIRVEQYGLTPVRCGGYAVAAFTAVFAVAAAVRPAAWVRWGWGWIALAAFAAGASPWSAVDVGVGAQWRRLEAFRARRGAGEEFDMPTRHAIMGAWDASNRFERRGGHWRASREAPAGVDAFREEWGFAWASSWERRRKEEEAKGGTPSRHLAYGLGWDAVSCPPGKTVRKCGVRAANGRIVLRGRPPVSGQDAPDVTDAVMGMWNAAGDFAAPNGVDLGGGRWLLPENLDVYFTEEPDGRRVVSIVYGTAWLFEE